MPSEIVAHRGRIADRYRWVEKKATVIIEPVQDEGQIYQGPIKIRVHLVRLALEVPHEQLHHTRWNTGVHFCCYTVEMNLGTTRHTWRSILGLDGARSEMSFRFAVLSNVFETNLRS